MGHQNTPHSPDTGSENTHIPNTYVRSKARVFFVRHGKTEKDTGASDSAPQSSNAELDDIGKKQIKEVAIYLSNAGIGDENDILLYGDDTTRVCESVQIITEEVISENNLRKKITPRLRTTKKGIEGVKRIKENTAVFTDTVVLMEQIRRWVNIHIKGNTTGIILVGHKSNKSGSEQAADNINEAIGISFDEIETGGIIERDIDANTGKYIDPKKHPETLFLNRGNYKEILESLEDIPDLNDLIIKFRKNTQIEAGKYPIWELQNSINAYFHENSEAFSRFLNDKNSPIHLRVFCLGNLIIQGEYTTIENYYLSPKCIGLSTEEKKLLLENIKNEKIMKILRKLFISQSELWEDGDQTLIGEYLTDKEYNNLKGNREIYQKATKIQSRSLDEGIKLGKKGSVMKQEVKSEVKIKVKDREYNYKRIISLDDIIQSEASYILPAMVGSGKSIWATDLVKKVITDYPEKQILFYEGYDWSKLKMGEIEYELKERISNMQNTILLIDAFDEIGADINHKKQILGILGKLKKKGLKIIITGRPIEFHETKDEGYETLSLIFQRNKFIELKGGNYKKQIKNLIERSSLSNTTLDNPLFILFICELANKYNQYKALGISSLNAIIKNNKQGGKSLKSILYENIIKLILAKHKGMEPERKTIADYNVFFNDIFSQLSILAISNTNNKDFSELIKEQGWTKSIQSYFFNRVSILLKKEEGENYGFAHLSFQEYFIFHYRENCYKEGELGKRKWKKVVNGNKNIPNVEILTSVGMMDFKSFEQDVNGIIEKGTNIPVCDILMSINKINDESSYNLLEKIVDLEAFKNSPEAICLMLIAIFNLENPNGDIGNNGKLINPLSYKFLEKIVDLEAFKNSPEAIQLFCGVIRVSKNPLSYKFLEKIVDLGAFKNSPEAISSFCWAIEHMEDSGNFAFLEKIVDLEAFKNSPEAIFYCLQVIRNDNNTRNNKFLEKIVDLEAFKNSPEAIQLFCGVIRVSKNPLSYKFLEKIVDLGAFKNSPEAISSFCWAIEHMEDSGNFAFLEKIVDLEAFKNSPEAISSFCWAIEAIKNPNEITLLEKIVEYEAFKNSPEANSILCCAIGRSTNIKDNLYLLEQIESRLLHSPIVLYNLSCVYSIFNMKDRSILRLSECLEYIKLQGSGKLEDRINAINKDADLNNIKKDSKFIKLIGKYSKLIKKVET